MDRLASRFRCDFSVGDAIGNLIIWLILMIVTLGLAAFVFPYYVARAVINRTTVLAKVGATQRKRKTDVQYHRQTDDLWAGFEITKGIVFCH